MINNGKTGCSPECSHLAWRPIFAGALVALGFTFLLNLFASATELAAYTTNSEGVETLALGGLLATALSVVVSMFAAGWLTGYLSKSYCNTRHLGALSGFLAWCVALLLAVFLADHIQHYVTFYSHFLSGSTEMVEVNGASTVNHVAMAVSKHEMKSIVISKYIVFTLFFLSAFASSFGGHCGMRHTCKK